MTFNHDNDTPFYRSRIKRLQDEAHDPSDWKSACEKAMVWDDETIYTGLFFQSEDTPTLGDLEPVLEDGGPLAFRELGITKEQSDKIISRMQ